MINSLTDRENAFHDFAALYAVEEARHKEKIECGIISCFIRYRLKGVNPQFLIDATDELNNAERITIHDVITKN